MTKEFAERVAHAVRRSPGVDADGGLALCFSTGQFDTGQFDIGTGALLRCLPVPEGTAYVDELFVRDLAAIIATFGPGAAILAVRRPDGRPTRTDRRLWRRTTAALVAAGPAAAEVRLDLLIVGPESTWVPRPASKAAPAA